MGENPRFVESDELTMVLTTKQIKEITPIIPLDPNRPGQLLLWEAIKIVPVPEGPIVSEK